MSSVYRCGVPEHAAAGRAQWPTSCKRLGVWFNPAGLRGSDPAELRQAFAVGMAAAARACGASFYWADSLAAADIEVQAEWMRGSTLAYAYFPQNTCAQRLAMRINSGVTWDNLQYFADVVCHELGHNLGLPHQSSPDDVMYWQIRSPYTAVYGHQSTPELVARYGPPEPTRPDPGPPGPDPDPPIPEPPDMDLPWEKIIEIVLDLMSNCLRQGRTEGQVLQATEATIAGDMPFLSFRLSARLRRELGKTRRQWREEGPAIMAAVMTKGSSLSTAELSELIGEAKAE